MKTVFEIFYYRPLQQCESYPIKMLLPHEYGKLHQMEMHCLCSSIYSIFNGECLLETTQCAQDDSLRWRLAVTRLNTATQFEWPQLVLGFVGLG